MKEGRDKRKKGRGGRKRRRGMSLAIVLENQPRTLIGRTDAKVEASIL